MTLRTVLRLSIIVYYGACMAAVAPQSYPVVEDRAGRNRGGGGCAECGGGRQAQILLWPGAEQRRRSRQVNCSRFRQLILDRVILSLKPPTLRMLLLQPGCTPRRCGDRGVRWLPRAMRMRILVQHTCPAHALLVRLLISIVVILDQT